MERADSPVVQALRAAVPADVTIPPEEWSRFVAILRRRTWARRELLVRQGTISRDAFFLAHGVVRYFHVRDDEETTLGFDPEGRFVGSIEGFFGRRPAAASIEALVRCEALAFSRDALDALARRHDCWTALMRSIAEASLLKKADKEVRLRTLSPEERYRRLQREDSYLLKRVPLRHLASFLGIAPETLSRLRARLGVRRS